MREAYPYLFGTLFCAVIVWFYLCNRMFKTLETRHPEAYEAMGKPSLIMNNSISSNIAFIKFLFGRNWKVLKDEGLSKLGNTMLIFFMVYVVGFIFLVVSSSVAHAS